MVAIHSKRAGKDATPRQRASRTSKKNPSKPEHAHNGANSAEAQRHNEPPHLTKLDQTLLPEETRAFYCKTLRTLQDAKIPFLVGGAYAFAHYTGIERHTKDFDIFTRPEDGVRTLEALAAIGYQTEMTFPHWLGKARCEKTEGFIDVIFSSGNGVARVDDEWFAHAPLEAILGVTVTICPVEEMLWSKSMIMERERYDGADIAHLLRARASELDWARLLRRFGPQWRVLLSHLVLFGFTYPEDRRCIPEWVMDTLLGRLRDEMAQPAPEEHICNGSILSREQYLVDLEQWGYEDGRITPHPYMSPEQTAQWTAAINNIP